MTRQGTEPMVLFPTALQEPRSTGHKSPKFRVLSTDPDWIEVLRRHDLHNNINFWRKDRRQVHLPEGSHFYFWPRGSRSVAGRAVFRNQLEMSISEAWERFGVANGATSYEDFRRKVADVLGLSSDTLTCLVCDDVQLLDPQEYPQLPPNFRATQNPKDYSEGSLPEIESSFVSIIGVSLSDLESQLAIDGAFDPDAVKTAREAILRAIVIRRGAI